MCIRDRLEKFYSRFKCPGAISTNAFAVSWAETAAWVCPPTGKIVEVIKKIVRSAGMSGVLIVPAWRTAVFWPFVSPNGSHINKCFSAVEMFKPFLLQGETNTGNNLMGGFTAFPFLALHILSNGMGGKNEAGEVALPKTLWN